MASPDFNFRIPTGTRAYQWVMKIKDSGENLSRALRLLIETHGEMFDTLYSRDQQIVTLKRTIKRLENQDSPDYRAYLAEQADYLARVKREDRGQ